MNKKVLVNEILDLYDTIEGLKNRLAFYEKKTESRNENTAVTKETPKDIAISELASRAKQLLFNEVFSDWDLNYTNIEVKEDGGEFNFLTFEQWIKALDVKTVIKGQYKYLLNDLTFNDVKEFFVVELKKYFDKRVNDKKMELVRSKKNE